MTGQLYEAIEQTFYKKPEGNIWKKNCGAVFCLDILGDSKTSCLQHSWNVPHPLNFST